MKLETIEQRDGMSVGDVVYETIKKNIINFNIKPGNRISEKEISELLNVSRTPVREAFIKLSKEELVYVLPQRGTYVSYINLDYVEEVRFIRESLESAVIKLATQDFSLEFLEELEDNIKLQRQYIEDKSYTKFLELDEAFHRTIFKGCCKEKTWAFIEQINTQYKQVRLLSYIAHVNWDQVISQHQELIDAIKNKNNDKGQKIINGHLKKLLVDVIELKEKYPEYFE